MAFRGKKRDAEETVAKVEEKVLDVDASMQGSLAFRDPVNLRINGKFEGSLDTKGSLTIGENSQVRASIIGEEIIVSGKVVGSVVSSRRLSLTRTANLQGDIKTPRLSVAEGAILQGRCEMSEAEAGVNPSTMQEALMTLEELAKYLEVDASSVLSWADAGKIPAQREGSSWRFNRSKVDSWIASEKIK